MRRWQCTECGAVIDRPQPPARCRRCDAPGTLVVAEEESTLDASESLFEEWVRHGMRTTRHWRAHT